ncbi:Pr6Pr family membrane protein [Streptococcus orisasini]|uniref:Pr6Pr family membrane protein n=1 Tax=Streptococcus orisasini TaxID=1080071 RepID=UPI00070EAC11|nr:Pr6Pr family membrane protein [Streptococcus orisasini]
MSKTLTFRILIALAGIIGVSIQIKQSGWGMLLYYTTLSNVLVFSFLIYLIIREIKNQSYNSQLLRLKGGVTMIIVMTFMVYHFILAPKVRAYDYYTLRNFLVHYVLPLGMIADTLIIDRPRVYRWFDPLLWTCFPLIYFALALFNGFILKWSIPGAADNPFPYFFINVVKYGSRTVLINACGIAAVYLLIGYILVLIKYFIGPKSKLN